ncbi:CRISPR-associated helicase Cas3' [bacterium]|nr:CRISPR-associated helicase Cas3' [bacterium]
MPCRILSHPDTDLIDHLTLVKKIGLRKFDEDGVYPDYRNIIECALFMHDLGKAHPDFQDKIRNKKHREYHHAPISAQWLYFLMREKDVDNKKSFIAFYIVYSHHGNLRSPREQFAFQTSENESKKLHYDYLNDIYSDFVPYNNFFSAENYQTLKLKYCLFENISKKDYKLITQEDYLLVNYLFSILIYADKKASILKEKADLETLTFSTWQEYLVDNYKLIKFRNTDKENLLNNLREEAYQATGNNIENISSLINSINLPTGMGKTLNVVNVALKLKKKLKKKRIIYALPFTSIIEQNAEVLEEILLTSQLEPDNTRLLKQHHLVEFSYKSSNSWDEGEGKFLIENWESEFVLTTFYQLLNTLISSANKQLIKLNNLVDSIIILDEVQNIPTRYWLLANNILRRCAEKFRIHFILTTATMPLIFSKENKEITELVEDYQKYYQQVDRIDLDCSNLNRRINMDELVELILDEENIDLSQLIILNSVKASLDLFQKLDNLNLDQEILYLSTNIVPQQRADIINTVKKNPVNKILISTQLIEAGVDIDFDIVYRDLAPLDSIFQACGRCNRHNNKKHKSQVVMFELISDKEKAYWSFIYDKPQISATREILLTKIIPESDFEKISQQFYQRIYDYLDNSNSEKLLESINKLGYDQIDDAKDGFCLIKDIPTISFYIYYNDEASELHQEFLKIINTEFDNPFKKSVKIKAISRKMSKYIVNLPKGYAWNNEDNLFIVDGDNLQTYYDLRTGFKREFQQEDLIL